MLNWFQETTIKIPKYNNSQNITGDTEMKNKLPSVFVDPGAT